MSVPATVDPAHRVPERPVRPRMVGRDDGLVLVGSAASGMSLVWVVYERLLPLSGPVGFWLLSYVAFLAIYRSVVRSTHGALAARDRVMAVVVTSGALGLAAPLTLIILFVFSKGIGALVKPAFFTQTLAKVGPLSPEDQGGAQHAIVGTLEQLGLTVAVSAPLGVATAVFLNEVGGRLARPVRTIVDAMSGVPSIVAGLFVYSLLIRTLGWSFSGFAASLALAMLMLPSVTRTTEEVLRLVPGGLRESALALGAPEWRATLQVVLPTVRAGVVTAVILGMARAVGETAPLIMTSFNSSVMNWNPFSGPQSSLPIYVYRLVGNSDPGQVRRAWAGALALIVLVLGLFTMARWVGGAPQRRERRRQRRQAPAPAPASAAAAPASTSAAAAPAPTVDLTRTDHPGGPQ
ncbi:MAG: phosphate ABC transporter permease PstA [Actinobacteria bacterium]|nr:phosphate ABC transporter permease PstA [Actinomycetota bacterium]